MNPIGGYFELELPVSSEYHANAIRLNTGRNALEYILKARRYKKVYIPYYTCDVLLQPVRRLGLEFEFYSINDCFEPKFDFGRVKADEVFLYTNYFGLKLGFMQKLAEESINIILDCSQSFFSRPLVNVDTFYSPRKFFGLSDGGYLYCNRKLSEEFEIDISADRIRHLIERIDFGAEMGYASFKENDRKLDNLPMMGMSMFTQRMLRAINYKNASSCRINNFRYLNEKLSQLNEYSVSWDNESVPMIYPFVTSNPLQREKLISNKIFVATYWPNVLEWAEENSFEVEITKKLIPIPIDQRYSLADMNRIISIIHD